MGGLKGVLRWALLAVLQAVASEAAMEFLIMSQPTLRAILYVKLPDTVPRLLVPSGINAPKAIAVDQAHNRLFIVDAPAAKIVWYQLIALKEGRLLTDGIQHDAIVGWAADGITVDGQGNLYFTGKAVAPELGPQKIGVWKQPFVNIQTGVTNLPSEIYSSQGAAGPNPVNTPSGLGTDGIHLFWANTVSGKQMGTVVRADAAGPTPDSVGLPAFRIMSDNADTASSVVLTPKYAFWATGNSIYGVSKNQANERCGESGCVLVTDQLDVPMGMVFDGDGTVYVADQGKGAVYSFSSGDLEGMDLIKTLDADGVYGVDLFRVDFAHKPAHAGAATFSALFAAVMAALVM